MRGRPNIAGNRRGRGVTEIISDAAGGQDMAGVGQIEFNFLAEFADMNVDHAGDDDTAAGIEMPQEFFSCVHSARRGDVRLQLACYRFC